MTGYKLLLIFQFALNLSAETFSVNDLIHYWSGYESLNSASLNYQERQIFLEIKLRENDDNLIYNSNSDFIYNSYLSWVPHHLDYNKDLEIITFGRKFNTPLGIIGTQEIKYKILESSNNLILEHVSFDSSSVHTIHLSPVSLENYNPNISTSVKLGLNFPNPFNPRTIIPITVIKKESFSISIYDSNGRLVNEIFNGTLNPGNFSYSWNGKNNNNIFCAAGIYFCRIVKNNEIIHTKKMILLK